MGWFRRGTLKSVAGKTRLAPIYLDGAVSWRTRTEAEYVPLLNQLPVGTEIVVTAVPQLGRERTVALYYRTACVGRMVGRHAAGLAPAIAAAYQAGYGVLLRAKRIEPEKRELYVAMGSAGLPSDSMLEVRATLGADLYYWLQHPAEQRAIGFFELAWVKTTYQDYYQPVRNAVLGERDSVIYPCTFSTGPRNHDPYTYQPYYGSKPAQPAIGKFADVHAGGYHLGELRIGMHRRDNSDVLKILNGSAHGMARLDRWRRDFIELRVCIADPEGCLPWATGPFRWHSERKALAEERALATVSAFEVEKVDGRTYNSYKKDFRELKASGQLEKARDLGLRMTEAAERVAATRNQPPQRWYTWETAVILRKLKDRESEAALLQRFLDHCPPGTEDAKIAERLRKLLGS
jgi:hypothetical protein